VILDQYKSSEKRESIDNCIKVLIRCKKTYEAKATVSKILKNILKREKIREEVDTTGDRGRASKLHSELLQFSAKVYKDIRTLQEEHRNMKRPFVFQDKDYLEYLVRDSKKVVSLLNGKFGLGVEGSLDEQGQVTP